MNRKVAFLVGLAAALGVNQAQAVDWNWNGDVRERYESQLLDKDSAPGAPGLDRNRLRVRLGVYPWINDELSAGVQLSTDTNNTAVSNTITRNQNFGQAYLPKNIYLNEEFIDYHPKSYCLDGKVNIILGKRDVSNTLIRVDNLVYSSDLSIEGATLQYGKDGNGKEKDGVILVAGYYFVDELASTTNTSPAMYLAQGAYKGDINEVSYLFGAGYNVYRSLQNLTSFVDGNTTTSPASVPANWTHSGYDIAEFFGKVGGQLTDTLPWKVYGQYALNTADHADYSSIDNNKRNAWLAGVTIGDAKQVGQWALDAKYTRIERDAVFPLVTDANRKVTDIVNIKGFEVAATYHLVQNMTIGARYYNYSNINDSTVPAVNPTLHQLQLDAMVKF